MVRLKNRYFVIEVIIPGKSKEAPLSLKPYSFHNAITKKIQQMHGDFGAAAIKSGFATKYCNEKTKIALIKVRHGPHKIIATTLPFVDQMENKIVTLRTLYVGATMKQCFKFVQNHQRKRLAEVWATLKTDRERIAYQTAIENFDVENDIKIL